MPEDDEDFAKRIWGRHHPELLAVGQQAEDAAHEAATLLLEAARSVAPGKQGTGGAEALEEAVAVARDSIRAWQPNLDSSIVEAWARAAIELSDVIKSAISEAGRAAHGSTPEVASALNSAKDRLVEAAIALFMTSTTLAMAGPDDKAVVKEFAERSMNSSTAAKRSTMEL